MLLLITVIEYNMHILYYINITHYIYYNIEHKIFLTKIKPFNLLIL